MIITDEIRPDLIRGLSNQPADANTQQDIAFALDDAVAGANRNGVADAVRAVCSSELGTDIGQAFETAFASVLFVVF